MTAPIGPSPVLAAGGVTSANSDQRLRQTAQQMEGVFVDRLFAAMRATVSDDGIVPQDNAQSMFSDMLDARVADDVPKQLSGSHSLADALYRQLRQKEDAAASPQITPAPAGSKKP